MILTRYSDMQPVSHLRISDQGIDLLVDREGLRLEAYQDTVGVWTIGLGHTSAAGPPAPYPGLVITEDEAWDIFWDDAEMFRHEARGLVTVPLEPYQYDALSSFIFNIGTSQFRSSTMLKRLNAADYTGAAEALLWWDKPPEVMTRRRGEYYQFKGERFEARVA